MNEITIKNNDGKLTVSSRQVAKAVGKEHKELLRDIRKYCDYLGESKIALTDFFIESTYTTEQNKTLPCFLCTRKGCEMIANKLTGQKGITFTALYINAFHEMENHINQTERIRNKAKTLEIEEINAKIKLSNQYLRLSKTAGISKSQKKALFEKSVEVLAGGEIENLSDIEFETSKLEAEDDVREILECLNKEEYGYKIEWEYITATEFINQHQKLAKYTAVAVGKALAKLGYEQVRMRRNNGQPRRCRMLPVKKTVTCH